MNAILKEDPPELSGTGRGISPGSRASCAGVWRSAPGTASTRPTISRSRSRRSRPGSRDRRMRKAVGSVVARAVGLTKRHKKAFLATLAAMVLVAVGLYRGLVRSPAPAVVGAIDSVAVLPFENVGGDPDREYLSDGVAETLINELSRLPNLQGHRAQHELSLQGQRCRPTTGGARSRGRGGTDRTRLPAGRHPGHRSRAGRCRPGDAALGRAIQHQDGRHLRRAGGHRRRHLARTASEAGAQGRDSSDHDATPRTPRPIGSIS